MAEFWQEFVATIEVAGPVDVSSPNNRISQFQIHFADLERRDLMSSTKNTQKIRT